MKIVTTPLIITGILLFIVCITVLIAIQKAPNFLELRSSVKVKILLQNGKESYRLIGPKAHGWSSLENISNYTIMAVISAEDTSFFYHKGIDFYEIHQAIKKDLREKRWARGASTITQQVVKNVYLTSEKSIFRKVLEIIWAWKMEKTLSKSEILCFYLNMVEFGPGIYGIQNAAQYYFNLPPSELNIKQSAFLAMLLPSPRKYHSYFQKKTLSDWANKRINRIIRVMNKLGFISDLEYEDSLLFSLWGESTNEDKDTSELLENDTSELEKSDESNSYDELDEPEEADFIDNVLKSED